MRQRTRGQLLARLKRYRQVAGNSTSASEDERLRAYLDDAYRTVFEFLGNGLTGFGLITYETTLASAVRTIELPENFDSLRALVFNAGQNARIPESTTPITSLQVSRFQGDCWGYWIEGPGSDWDGMVFTPYSRRLRFTHDVPAGTKVTLVYVQLPPTLEDVGGGFTDAAQDDTITVDTIAESVEAAMIGYARVWAASRDDAKEQSRAMQDLRAAAQAYMQTRERGDYRGSISLDDY